MRRALLELTVELVSSEAVLERPFAVRGTCGSLVRVLAADFHKAEEHRIAILTPEVRISVDGERQDRRIVNSRIGRT